MNDRRNLKKPLLYLLVGSVILGAFLGIIIVLRNTWGWFEVRVIITTVTVAIASLCGLACDLSKTPRAANVLPIAGLILTFIAASLVLVGMWSDLRLDGYWKTTVSLSIFSVATVHACLLSKARLASRFRWIFVITVLVIYGLAIMLSTMIFWEIDGDWVFRLLAAVSIVAAALTLVIPLLHRIGKTDANPAAMQSPLDETDLDAIDDEIASLKKRIAELEKRRSVTVGRSEVVSDPIVDSKRE